MFISGNSTYTPSNQYVGRLGDTRDNNSNLIYIYPIVFDVGLMKKWEGIIRDFQTAQFVNQIKTTNVLNILQVVTNKSLSNDQNELMTLLSRSATSNTTSNNASDTYHQMMLHQMLKQERQNESNVTTQEYVRRNREVQNYIKDQITNDPRYENLRPAFSIISLENNMVDIPLVIGTKSYKVNSSAMFWMLFVGLAQNNTGFTDIRSVINTIQRIPEDRYLDILNNTYAPTALAQDQNFYDQFKREGNQSLEKAMRVFSSVAGSLSDFESDIGFGTNISADSALFTSINTQSTAEFDSAKATAKANINNEIVRVVFPLMQNLNNAVTDPNISVDFASRYQNLLNVINRIANDEFEELNNVVAYSFSNTSDLQSNFEIFKRHCTAINSNTVSSTLLDNISHLRLYYRDLMGGTGTTDIVNLLEKTHRISYELKALSQQFLQILADIFRSPNMISRDTTNQLYNAILAYYYDGNASNDNIFVPGSPNIPDRMLHLFGNTLTTAHVDQFFHNNVTAFANIASFIIVSSLIRSMCEYMSQISAKINIKSRDVTKFPNYTLVIPIEYATTLYYALASRNLNQILNNVTDSQLSRFKLSETEIFRIIPAINNRLNVPNIVFIDDSKDTIYYQWSFLKKTFKLSKSSIESYIRSQTQTIRAF